MAKPNPHDPPGAWHTWTDKPDEAAVAEQVAAFFAAIRSNEPGRAFGICPHAESSKPYLVAPTRDSVKQAWKLLARVLTDNGVTDKTTTTWFSQLTADAPAQDAMNNVTAPVRFDGRPTKLVARFKLVEHAARWQLTFYMLRVA